MPLGIQGASKSTNLVLLGGSTMRYGLSAEPPEGCNGRRKRKQKLVLDAPRNPRGIHNNELGVPRWQHGAACRAARSKERRMQKQTLVLDALRNPGSIQNYNFCVPQRLNDAICFANRAVKRKGTRKQKQKLVLHAQGIWRMLDTNIGVPRSQH